MRSGSSTRFVEELSFPQRECSDRFVASSIPSPCLRLRCWIAHTCDRFSRLRLLWIDLTPDGSLQAPSVSRRLATSHEEVIRSPEFKFASLNACHSLMDPDGPSRANQLRPFSAGFHYVKSVAIRISFVTRLYQLLGDCESPCGLHSSLCTLRRCCFTARRHSFEPVSSDHHYVSISFMRLS